MALKDSTDHLISYLSYYSIYDFKICKSGVKKNSIKFNDWNVTRHTKVFKEIGTWK